MSVVTGIVLCTGIESESDDEADFGTCWARIQAWLVERDFGQLAMVDHAFGGTKSPQMQVGGAGLNHFGGYVDDFAAFVIGLPWRYPEDVVLVMHHEHCETQTFRPT